MPYSWGLLDSLPRIDDVRGDRLRTIEGMPPVLIRPPDACRFNPRCPYARDVCRENEPELTRARRDRPPGALLGDGARRVDRVTATAPPRDSRSVRPARSREPRRGRRPQGPLPDPGRHLPDDEGDRQGRRRRHLRRPPRRDARARRRVGLRQEHHRPGDDPAARADGRDRPIRRRRPRQAARARRAAPDAPPDADHLPGPVRLARSADDGRLRSIAEPLETHDLAEGDAKRRAHRRPASPRRARSRSTSGAIRTSSRAASDSASASPGRSRSSPSSSSATSPSRRSTCRSRPRSSTCSPTSSAGSG